MTGEDHIAFTKGIPQLGHQRDVVQHFPRAQQAMSSSNEQQAKNITLARRFLEARGRADLDAMEQMMAPTSSTTPWLTANSLTASATSVQSPSTFPPSLTSASSSKIK
jgi:hypothetical protein